MADVRSNGTFLLGNSQEDDFIQGYNAPSSPGDNGRSQILTGFGSELWAAYGLTLGVNSADTYKETAAPIADGNDSILGGLGNDILLGGGGNDQLIGGAPGGEGNDDTLYGGWGDDVLIGGNAAQTSDGGIDNLYGGPGNDVVNGMDMGDTIDGGDGTDVAIYSGPKENYSIVQDEAAGVVYITDLATGARDTLTAMEYAFFGTAMAPTPTDAMARIDRFIADPTTDLNVVALGMFFTKTGDTVDFNDLDDAHDDLAASYTVDTARDHLYDAKDGNDVVRLPDKANYTLSETLDWDPSQLFEGGDGDDKITGGDGDDFIAGGKGNDTLNGGPGSDTFKGVDAKLTGDIKEDGHNEIDGGDLDPTEEDIVAYDGNFLSYSVKMRVDFIKVSTQAGNSDTVKNWERLVFNDPSGDHNKDVTIKYDDLIHRGVLAYAIWALDDAFEQISPYLGHPDDWGGSANFTKFLKWFELAGKAVDVASELAVAPDLRTGIEKLVGITAHKTLDPFIDKAGEKLNEQIDALGLPSAYSELLKQKVVEGQNDLHIVVDRVTSEVFSTLADTIEGLRATDWNALWKTWMDGVSHGIETKYKEQPGFQAPKVDFDDPRISEPEISPAPEPTHEGTSGSDLHLGSNNDDTLYPGDGDDITMGFGGNDTFVAGHGNGDDLYDGGDGNDTITFPSTTLGIVVDLQAGTASGEEIGNDTLVSIENVTGGSGNDNLSGDAQANIMTGGGGNDRLEGRGGLDTARYLGASGDFSVVDNGDGTFAVTDMKPSDGDEGTDTLSGIERVEFGDGVAITLGGVEHSPPTANADSYQLDEDTPLTVGGSGVLTNDVDAENDPLTAIVSMGPTHGSLTLNPDGSFSYTPDPNYNGTDSFTYKANDGTANSGETTVNLVVNAVNDVPVTAADSYQTAEDQAFVIPAQQGVLSNDVDNDNDHLTTVVIDGPDHGDLVLNADGSFTYTPNANYNGTDNFTYQASDGTAGSAPTGVDITISAANDAPVANGDARSVTAGHALELTSATLLSNDTDADGDPLTITSVGAAAHGTVALDATGTLVTFTPEAGYAGPASFSYEVSDGNGGISGATVNIAVNAPGSFALTPLAQSYLTAGNELINGLGGTESFGETELVPNDDGSTGAVDITSVFGAAGLNFFGASYASIYVNNNGNITFAQPTPQYTPSEITGGTANPIIAAFWGDVDTRGGPTIPTPGGNSNGGNDVTYDLDADNGVLTITWNDVGYYNSHPDKANAFQMQLISEGNGDFDIVFRYENINWSAGDASSGSGGLGGVPARVGFSAGNGTDYYELPQSGNEAGMLSLEDTVGNTGKEGVWLFQVRSGVVLPPENVAPVANGDTTEVIAGEQLTIAVADLLANDTDQDGNALSVTGVSDAVHGTVSLDEVNHQVTFIPDEGYVGQASFGYQISDGHGGVSQATVAVQVDPPQNHAPVGAADAYVTDEDTQLVVAVGGGVLANDTDTDSNPLTAVLETGPAHGTLSLNEDGSFVYTPEANYSGEDGFSYRASDGTDSTSPIEVKLTANAVNDAPVAFDGTASGTTNMTITGTLPAASDVDSNGLTYSLVEGSSQHGSATVNANGSFTFTPDAGYSGPADFRYLVTDDQAAASEAATLSILIAPAALHIEESDLKPKLGACDTGAVLGPDDLKTVGAASQAIVYKISALASGVILVDGVIAALGDTFTQADVDSGRVAILAGPVTPSDAVSTPRGAIPGAAASHQDGFAFEVTDGSGQSLHGEFTIAYEQFDTVQTSPWKGAYSGGAGDDYQLGTARGDVMEGKGGCDTIIGGGGDDVMSGGNGNDRIFGGDGRDCITAGSGNNLLDGGKGGDWIAAGNGHNWIFGGDGNDQILAGSGNNHIFGGTGSDCIVVGNGINRIDGGSGNDTITSGKGADTVVGGLGNDLIFDLGGSNKFQLGGVAGAASDGDDVYSTGRGADKFALFTADKDGGTAGSGRDTIKHFNLAEGDRLVAFNAVAGFWDDPNALKGLIHSGAVSGSRSAHGGDLTLVFSDGHDRSSVTLESFFQDNRSCGRNTHDGRVIGESDLLDILKDVVQDGGDFGISGDDFVAKAHDWFDRDFMLS